MAVGIGVAYHVAGDVLELLLYCLHIGGKLHGQKAGGLVSSAYGLEDGLVLDAEGEQYGIGVRLYLAHYHWP